jgi:NTE family protein
MHTVKRWRGRPDLLMLILGFQLAACGGVPYEYTGSDAPRFVAPVAVPAGRPKIALVLGSGGRRGFAHVGVIKALEASGIVPDLIVGASIGSLIGALYAGGMSAAQLEQLAVEIDLSDLIDISFLHWGYVRGQAVQDFVNEKLQQRPIEQLSRPFAAIVTRQSDNVLQIFNAGNPGVAVRAASAVPDRFLPVRINGVVYVDGDVASPVPARAARRLGADVVIAVDISAFVEDVPDDVPDDWVRQDVARRNRIDTELVAAD